ncbi:MAG: protein kinase, partial [Candidatus Hydrogenedentes bacterium]|nr:protein kinase [Candidatus Hydrogenedentota bacterium]
KPSNVMSGEFGETVVLDWGLAKIRGQEDAHLSELEHTLRTLQLSADAKSVETAEGQIMGTPVFMPPEQARGEIDSITERSDVYSLGAVLYSILAGRFPYRGKSAADVLRQVLAQEPEPIESIEPHAPPELVAVCRRAMQRDPEKRYANGKELAEEVGRFLSGALVGAYEYSIGEHLSRFAKRHKTALGTAAACVAVLVGFAVFSFARIAQERDEAVQARNAEEEQRLVAVQAKDDEQTQRARAEKQLYLSNVLLARYRIEERRFDLALQLLDAAPAAYRDWEWDYLSKLGHADSWTFGGHTQIVEKVSVTADGARILTASDDGSARLLNAADGSEIKTLTGDGPSLVNAEINRGGSCALVQAADDSVTLFDTESGATMARLESIHTAHLSASGEWFVTTAPDGQVQRWSEKGETQWSAAGPPGLNSAVLSPDDRFVAVGDTDTSVMLLDAGTGSVVKAANTPAGPVNRLVFNSTGQRLAVTHGGQVSVFSVPAMEIGLTLDTGSSDVTSAAFNEDATRIATGSDDGSAAVWDMTNGGMIARLNGHGDAIVGMAFHSPEHTVITASLDYTLRVWNADTGIELRMLQGHSGPIRGMCFHENSDAVWTASGDHSVKRWDVALGAATGETVLRGHTEDLLSLEFGPDQRTLVSVSRDATARLWSLPGIHEPWTVRGDNAAVSCASLSPDGKRLATGAMDGTVTIWSVETREMLSKLSKHTGPVSGVWYNPIRAQLLSVSRDNTAVLWAIEDGTPVFQKEIAEGGRGLGAISPDGERIALPAAENSAVLLDTGTGDSSTILKGHTQRITSFVFSPDSTKLATTSLDGTARLWNVADGALLYTLEGQTNEVTCSAFTPDGTQIATGTLSGTAHVWDVATGKLLHTLKGHGAMLVDLVYTREGTRLFSLSEDGTVRLWNPAEQVEMLRFKVGEPFQGDVAMACSEHEIAASWNGIDIMVRSAAVPAAP